MQHDQLSEEFKELQAQHNFIDAAYSDELLNAAKLHSQLAELQLLRTQNTMYAALVNKIRNITKIIKFYYSLFKQQRAEISWGPVEDRRTGIAGAGEWTRLNSASGEETGIAKH